jgi:hypothetical protein
MIVPGNHTLLPKAYVDPNQPNPYHASISSPHASLLQAYRDAKAKLDEMEKKVEK